MEGGYRVSVCVYWKCTPSWEITTLPSSLTVYMLSIPGILTLMWWTLCASSPAQNFCSQTVRQVYVQVLRRRNVSFCGLITVAKLWRHIHPVLARCHHLCVIWKYDSYHLAYRLYHIYKWAFPFRLSKQELFESQNDSVFHLWLPC